MPNLHIYTFFRLPFQFISSWLKIVMETECDRFAVVRQMSTIQQFFARSTHTNNWAILACTSRYWFNYRVRVPIHLSVRLETWVRRLFSAYGKRSRYVCVNFKLELRFAHMDLELPHREASRHLRFPRNSYAGRRCRMQLSESFPCIYLYRPRSFSWFIWGRSSNRLSRAWRVGREFDESHGWYAVVFITNKWTIRGLFPGRVDYSVPRSKSLLTDVHSNILVYLSGHGGDKFLKFQDNAEISAFDLAKAFKQMNRSERLNFCLFYTTW